LENFREALSPHFATAEGAKAWQKHVRRAGIETGKRLMKSSWAMWHAGSGKNPRGQGQAGAGLDVRVAAWTINNLRSG